MYLTTFVLFGMMITSTFSQWIPINIASNSLISVNNWDKTSNYLLGLTAYGGSKVLWKNEANQKKYNQQYGINSLGYAARVTHILPKKQSEAVSCCNTPWGAKQYINSGKACQNFKKSWNTQIYGQEYYKKSTTFETFLYLYDICSSGNYPTLNHCVAPTSHGQGTPKNDKWWQEVFIGIVKCALEVDPSIKHAHIWNEPGIPGAWLRDGKYYAQFYFDTAKAIKSKYPQMEISGPAIWGTAQANHLWEQYYTELMDKVVIKEKRPDLLDYIDFHAYIHSHNDLGGHARYDHLLGTIHAISHYYRALTNDRRNIRSVLTETNVNLDRFVSKYSGDQKYWVERCIAMAKSIMALSFSPDKLKIRQQFDMGAKGYEFNGKQDWKMYDLMKPVNDGYMVSFSFGKVQNGYPHFDNGDCIMTQSIYSEKKKSITTLLINYCPSDKKITLKDTDKKIKWSTTARFANRWQVNNKYTVGIGGNQVWATLKAHSVTAITGTYNNNRPNREIKEIEFISTDKSMVMRQSNPQQKDILSVTYNIKLNKIPNKNNYKYQYAYIKFGFFNSLMNDFKYKISVKSNNGKNTYLTITDYKPDQEYMQFSIPSKSSFQREIWNGNTIKIIFTGTRIQQGKKAWKPDAGRIVFVSLVCGLSGNRKRQNIFPMIQDNNNNNNDDYNDYNDDFDFDNDKPAIYTIIIPKDGTINWTIATLIAIVSIVCILWFYCQYSRGDNKKRINHYTKVKTIDSESESSEFVKEEQIKI